MTGSTFSLTAAFLLAACTDQLPAMLDEPDVARPSDCSVGSTALTVGGVLRDFVTGEPVAGASIDITEAWSPSRSFPAHGCALGHAVSGEDGSFEVEVTNASSDPVIVYLVTGAGRAPTIADQGAPCLFGCTRVDLEIAAPAEGLVAAWREELYDGGMPYALNRGLVAYLFHEHDGSPADRVAAAAGPDSWTEGPERLHPGSEVRYLAADGATLAPPDRKATTSAGVALIGAAGSSAGYYEVSGERPTTGEEWYGVGVIEATGWVYLESDTADD